MNKNQLARRTFLRGTLGGAALSVGVPTLECMLNANGTALAAGTKPLRFGVWYFGGGIGEGDFFPTQTGSNWSPTYQLEPLADPAIKGSLNVLGNLNTGYDGDPFTSHNIHHAVSLSGTGVPPARLGQGVINAPSIDQAVLSRFREQNLLPENGEAWVGMRCSDAGGHTNKASFRGGNGGGFVSLELNPVALFDRFFGTGQMQNSGGGDAVGKARMLVVDAIREDAKRLKLRVGRADQMRLDAHLEAIASLETRLQRFAEGHGCGTPMRPTVTDGSINGALTYGGDEGGRGESPATVHEAHADVLVMALSCDLVRVFSMEFMGTQTNAILQDVPGVTVSHHMGITHGNQSLLRETTRHVMENFASLLKKMQAVDEGDGTLLDNSAIFCTSESRWAPDHDLGQHFAVTAGKGGGQLNTGHYINGGDQKQFASVMMATANAVGANLPSVGREGSPGFTRNALSELL